MTFSEKGSISFFSLALWGLSLIPDDIYNNLLHNEENNGKMFKPINFFMGTNINVADTDKFLYLFIHFEACEAANKNKPPIKGIRVCKVEDIPEEIMPMFNGQFIDRKCSISDILDQDMHLGDCIDIDMFKELLKNAEVVIKDLGNALRHGTTESYKEELKKLNDLFKLED